MTAALATTTPDREAPAPDRRRAAEQQRPALRIVVRPAPAHEPPFDDELPADHVAPQLWDRQLPFEPARRPSPIATLPRPDHLPDPCGWTRRLLVGLIETADGRRPLAQVAPLLSLSVHHGLAGDFERAAASRRRHWLRHASVRSLRAGEPASGVAEVCATVAVGDRVRAVALRLEEHAGRWRCTRLQLG